MTNLVMRCGIIFKSFIILHLTVKSKVNTGVLLGTQIQAPKGIPVFFFFFFFFARFPKEPFRTPFFPPKFEEHLKTLKKLFFTIKNLQCQ